MRRDLLASGLILSFVGLAFMGISQMSIKHEPLQNWVTVAEAGPLQQPSYNMSVQGTLSSSDRFKVYFQLGPYSGGPIVEGAGVLVNLTDPSGYTESYDISVGLSSGGTLGIMEPFPEYIANSTGTYRANAEAFFVSIVYLAFQKMELTEIEPQYPNRGFFPVGVAIFAGGVGVVLLGAKISKRRRRFHKHKS